MEEGCDVLMINFVECQGRSGVTFGVGVLLQQGSVEDNYAHVKRNYRKKKTSAAFACRCRLLSDDKTTPERLRLLKIFRFGVKLLATRPESQTCALILLQLLI